LICNYRADYRGTSNNHTQTHELGGICFTMIICHGIQVFEESWGRREAKVEEELGNKLCYKVVFSHLFHPLSIQVHGPTLAPSLTAQHFSFDSLPLRFPISNSWCRNHLGGDMAPPPQGPACPWVAASRN
jgi:hypothetical protein